MGNLNDKSPEIYPSSSSEHHAEIQLAAQLHLCGRVFKNSQAKRKSFLAHGMTMNTLAKWLVMLLGGMRYPHLTEMILDDLDASTVAYVLDILGILEKCPYATKYLNPLRDFGGSVELLKQTEAEGFTALLIGPKLDLITKRIAHPRIYWEALERKYHGDAQAMWQANVVEAWVVCVYKDALRTMETAKAVPSRIRECMVQEHAR